MTNWTKRDVIKQAFAEIGKSDYEFDIDPESTQLALRQLDAMMAQWALQGIRVAFSGGDGKGEVDLDVNVPMWAVEGLYLNLALRLAPPFGKTLSVQTLANAREGKDTIRAGALQGSNNARSPVGYAGAGSYFNNLPIDIQGLQTGGDGALDFGESNDQYQ